MVTIIAKHRVRNYDQWRPTFDQFQSKRNEHGVTNGRVYRNADDANDLVLLFDATDEARARQYYASDDLRNGMETAGVDLSTFSWTVVPD